MTDVRGDAYDEPTCGQGLAHHSDLPAKLGQLTVAIADMLEHHMTALDLSDERSRKEHAAYRRLVSDHRKTGADLRALADAMAGHRDLPMGKHNIAALTSPDAQRIFRRLVQVEDELSMLLRDRLDEHRAMLGEMKSPPR